MAVTNAPKNPIANWEKLRDEWLDRLSNLVSSLEAWAHEFAWSTRRIEKRMEDSQLGTYQAPALLLQEGTSRVLLEPVARFVPGAEGAVDLYLMPAYDDIATLYFENGEWRLHTLFPVTSGPSGRDGGSRPLSKQTFKEVLDEMKKHVARAL